MKTNTFLYFLNSFFRRDKNSSEAYYWFSVLNSGSLDENEYQSYLDWAGDNPDKADQVNDLNLLWRESSPQSVLKRNAIENFSYSNNRKSIFISRPLAAMSCALFICLIGIFGFNKLQFPSPNIERYETIRGETTNINLPDGSIAYLNVLSSIEVSYTDNERVINLLEGEAVFSVVSNKDRPFIVHSGNSQVVALGTEFNTKLMDDNSFIITLVEGSIQVSNGIDSSSPENTILDQPGSQAKISLPPRRSANAQTNRITVSQTEISDALSWREGKIIFNGISLIEAIEEINKYTTHTLSLTSPEISNEPVFGVFNTGDWQGFLSAIETSYPIQRVNVGHNLTVLDSLDFEEDK